MYCVIQKIERKKEDLNGYAKELISYHSTYTIMGETKTVYGHHFSDEHFERPIKTAYRILLHDSYREEGKVKKHQYNIGTVGYYDLAVDFYTYDWFDIRIKEAAALAGKEVDELYKLIENKLNPLVEQIEAEFQDTEEFNTHMQHDEITTLYAVAKTSFNAKYGDYYDECYDVFGDLINPEKLQKVQKDYEFQQEYEEKSKQYQRSYYEDFFNNYNSGGYTNAIASNHNSDDKDVLKEFYKVLAKKFHPDSNPGKDTSKQMQVLNQLKDEWNI